MAPSKTLIDRTTPLLRQRIRGVFQQLPRALAGHEEAIHQIARASSILKGPSITEALLEQLKAIK